MILFGYSFPTHASASLAKRSPAFASNSEAPDADAAKINSKIEMVRGTKHVKFHTHVMPHRLCIFSCALSGLAQITAVSAADLNDNPLAIESALPYHYPPFDKIRDEHFVPAIEVGMREELKEIDPIANSSDEPTFDNTIVAHERSGRLLDRAQRTFSNLNACDTNPTRQK